MFVRRDDLLLSCFIVGGLFVAGLLSWVTSIPYMDAATWGALFDESSVISHASFVLLQVLQVVVPFIPGQATGVASGYVFGFWLGLTYTMIGTVLGSFIAYLLGNRFGRRVVTWFVSEETLSVWDNRIDRYGTTVFFLMILLPGFPDDALCFIAGMSDLRFDAYLVSVVFGRLPLFSLYAYVGSHAASFWSFAGLALAGGVGAISVACFVWRESLFAWLTWFSPK